MADTKLNIAELDFEQIKSSLKEYLQSQSEFTDYAFEGSALTVLLNLLAYNTHYNAYYANMLVNESFLDSAIKRASVVSRAKALGYTPRSARAATAVVDIIVNAPDNPATVILPKGTRITTNNNGEQYTFFVTTTMQTVKKEGVYKFENVQIKEGRALTYSYTVNKTTNPNLIFEIPAGDVDTSQLSVNVQVSNTNTSMTRFSQTDTIIDITGDSLVYWVQENYKGNFEIYFGDGVLGKALDDGNIVHIEYSVTKKDLANGARYFVAGEAIDGYSNISVITKSPAFGGADKESEDSIRFYAPKMYAANNRIVTLEDYKAFVSSNFANIESISAWGGEDNDPPIYGKVFVSVKAKDSLFVDDSVKAVIRDAIKKKSVVSVQVELVDADYLYVGIEPTVKVNLGRSPYGIEQLRAMVYNAIINYMETDLNKFDSDFYYSKLLRAMESASTAIVSSSANIRLMRKIAPAIGRNTSIEINFQNKINYSTLNSTVFNVVLNGGEKLCVLDDSPSTMPPGRFGTLRLKDFSSGEIVSNQFGSVDYETGKVVISSVNISSVPEQQEIFVYCAPADKDVFVNNNSIVTPDKSSSLYYINRLQGISEVKIEEVF